MAQLIRAVDAFSFRPFQEHEHKGERKEPAIAACFLLSVEHRWGKEVVAQLKDLTSGGLTR